MNNQLPQEMVNKIMEDTSMVENMGRIFNNMETENLGSLQERAEMFLQTDEGKKIIQNLHKKGLTRNKIKKQMKEAKKNKNTPIKNEKLYNCILINESRKVKSIKINLDDIHNECKKKLKFIEPEEYQCSNFSIGSLEDEKVKFWIDTTKMCEKNGNKKIKRLTGINNTGSILFILNNKDFDLNKFLSVENIILDSIKEE